MRHIKRGIQQRKNKRAMKHFTIDPIFDEADFWDISVGLPAPQERGRPEQIHPPTHQAPNPGWQAVLNRLQRGVVNSVYIAVPDGIHEEAFRASIEMVLEMENPEESNIEVTVISANNLGGEGSKLQVIRWAPSRPGAN